MTTPENTPAPDAVTDDAAETADIGEKKAAIPAFTFPFKPGQFAAAKDNQPSHYQKSNKHGDSKRPGVAPAGTRRSMGKR